MTKDARGEREPAQLVIHNDDETPDEFVIGLLRQVFGKSEREAAAVIARVEREEKATCGPYPQSVAEALFKSAQQYIWLGQHPLRITLEEIKTPCELCGKPEGQTDVRIGSRTVWLCSDCIRAADTVNTPQESEEEFEYACDVLDWHFANVSRSNLVTTIRQFPGHMRVDVQAAIEGLFGKSIRLFGLNEEQRYETLSISRLLRDGRNALAIAPLQYSDVDVGEKSPVKCLDNGLWLCEQDGLRYAVLLCAHREYSREPGIRIEILVPAGTAGAALVQQCFGELEQAVQAARSYRGKILSLDADSDYRGRSRGITVHRLPPVARDEVILPEQTLRLLNRNVLTFVNTRDQLRRLGQSTRKGILLYGPPGTGKTHTIRYLATHLPGHTTLIITAEQIELLGAYMSLARLLQPSMVVIEDVDLIARDRDDMGPCEESMLNKLLNEMDGLKEDADILFVLTTNRPEDLEGALAGRPGRIDQAIEVPLPDETGRGKLVRLYGKGLPLDDAIIAEAARRSEGTSCAFIKELMRRLAQGSLARDGGNSVVSADIDEALDDMLFSGGRLNAQLLGGAQAMATR
ncbi:ATP-dependent Clp protease adaptor ClpS [Bradyrhizobium sp. 180]|uniref:ATP-dependent Clp protease adaptor ClpS n=1 Tax=unclassified Bradyrhizobium TaxID=2631580 RepID=UPI001FF74B90|nr:MULTISPECIES: ATP-dependent Clp protease adaptor ClpS [unclassified Bradyrhizobium]MCK1490398.1 ATP-dependent Clp protease adaptor ClpS [Bradyrhizobium sp. 180]MCK1599361.1 ATP-dependent Clp protease adaptor ClpS [Bradyrhizobium sp. 164]MCK1616808.1 ATP-dependent Clp protease adaptor ClpS [Bradyrhizobium sp. 159]MCK1667254.1 ATP-dependent Clp protease adaptor ClpS [Bradyrhizobium sp. 153]